MRWILSHVVMERLRNSVMQKSSVKRKRESLRRVTFGPSSSLERAGAMCFFGCDLVEFEIAASVRAIGGSVWRMRIDRWHCVPRWQLFPWD